MDNPEASGGSGTDNATFEPLAQLSLFGVEAAPPAPGDLEGLLAGPGQVVRMGGTARVSVVVQDSWRARALVREFELRGLAASCVPTAEEHIGVRTAYSAALAPLAATWLRGAAMKLPPRDFLLEGRRLRLWAVAVGHLDALGFTLRLGASDEAAWPVIGQALAVVGLPAALLGPRAGGPAYRISGLRRLYRLAELVGDAPPEAPPGSWPGRHPGPTGTRAAGAQPAATQSGGIQSTATRSAGAQPAGNGHVQAPGPGQTDP